MKTSAARRLSHLFHEAAAHVGDKARAIKVWARVLAVEDKRQGNHQTEDAIMKLLQDVRDDVQLFEDESRGTEAEHLAAELVSHARQITSPAKLTADWRGLRSSHLSPEVLKSWEWAALHFPASEDHVEESSLAQLRSQLAELESAANDEGLPIELRRFIARQVERIRTALDRYRVRGIEPLREVITHTVGEVQRDHAELAESIERAGPKGVSVATKLGKVYRRMAELAGDIDKFAKASNAIMQLTDKARPVIDSVVDVATKVLGTGA